MSSMTSFYIRWNVIKKIPLANPGKLFFLFFKEEENCFPGFVGGKPLIFPLTLFVEKNILTEKRKTVWFLSSEKLTILFLKTLFL
jgi:hypothetical protein